MKNPVIAAILSATLLLTTACSTSSREEANTAADTAEAYYQLLAAGRYESFVLGMAGAEEMPAQYRESLAQLLHQQTEHRSRQHGEWEGIEAIQTEEEGDTALVTLLITFSDRTTERVLLPMVWIDGEWMMQ